MSGSTLLDKVLTGALAIAALSLAGIAARREIFGPPVTQGAVRAEPPKFEKEWRALSKYGTWIGDSQASVRLVEFADFECPYCARFHERFKAVRDSFTGSMSLLVVQFPIPGHRFARPAAIAAECANSLNAYEAFHDLLYAKQDSLGLKSWTSFAIDAGISDTARFNVCITNESGARKIDSAAAQGKRMAVGGTPTVLIEGWRYSQPPADSLLSIVKSAAAKQRD